MYREERASGVVGKEETEYSLLGSDWEVNKLICLRCLWVEQENWVLWFLLPSESVCLKESPGQVQATMSHVCFLRIWEEKAVLSSYLYYNQNNIVLQAILYFRTGAEVT